MPTDVAVVLRNQPGELARLGEVLVAAGVQLRGLAAFTGDGSGFGHALIDDKDLASASAALKREKIAVADTRDMLVVDVPHPGGVVEILQALAEANVNVDLSYTVCGDRSRSPPTTSTTRAKRWPNRPRRATTGRRSTRSASRRRAARPRGPPAPP